MTRIHATALVDPGAAIAADVEIGPYTIVGPHVSIGAGTRIGAHVILEGHTDIGADNLIGPFCALGGAPQDKKYAGEPTRLVIGDRNTIREYSFFNTGTVQGGGVTRIGNDNWLMAYVHIAHDCQVGNNIIMANSAQLAGHVELGDWVILGGVTGVHQFVKVGTHAMTGAHTYLNQDLPPYVMGSGTPAAVHGINAEGLKRRGFSAGAIAALRQAYKTLYRSGLPLEEARAALAEQCAAPDGGVLEPLVAFLGLATRGILR